MNEKKVGRLNSVFGFCHLMDEVFLALDPMMFATLREKQEIK